MTKYIFRHKYLFSLAALCVCSVALYAMRSRPDILSNQALLFAESKKQCIPQSLKKFRLTKRVPWQPYSTSLIAGDLFTSAASTSNLTTPLCNEKDPIIADEILTQKAPCTIQLNGWANIRGEILFVLSALSTEELPVSFLGRVGDSFENPALTLLSYDFENCDNRPSSSATPLLTILDKTLNENIILTPINSNETD